MKQDERKLSDVLAENREKLKDRPSRIKFSFNLVRHGSPTYSLLPLSSCLISPPSILSANHFYQNPLCERKINLKEKILEIELVSSKFSIFFDNPTLRETWKIFENFYFLGSKYQKISILLPLNGFLMERRFLIPRLNTVAHTFSSSTVFQHSSISLQ